MICDNNGLHACMLCMIINMVLHPHGEAKTIDYMMRGNIPLLLSRSGLALQTGLVN